MWSALPKKKTPSAPGEDEQAQVERVAQAIIFQAIRENAAAIQLDSHESEAFSGLRVQYLIENTWRETMLIPRQIEPMLVVHFKELAGLPMQYRMVLQGLILLNRGESRWLSDLIERDFDIPIEIVPTRQGEKITMRIEAVESDPESIPGL